MLGRTRKGFSVRVSEGIPCEASTTANPEETAVTIRKVIHGRNLNDLEGLR